MIRPKIATPEPPLPPTVEIPFLITAIELRDRKIKRRRKQDELPGRLEAILVEIGLKAKSK